MGRAPQVIRGGGRAHPDRRAALPDRARAPCGRRGARFRV